MSPEFLKPEPLPQAVASAYGAVLRYNIRSIDPEAGIGAPADDYFNAPIDDGTVGGIKQAYDETFAAIGIELVESEVPLSSPEDSLPRPFFMPEVIDLTLYMNFIEELSTQELFGSKELFILAGDVLTQYNKHIESSYATARYFEKQAKRLSEEALTLARLYLSDFDQISPGYNALGLSVTPNFESMSNLRKLWAQNKIDPKTEK